MSEINQTRPVRHYTGDEGREYHAKHSVDEVKYRWVARLRAEKSQRYVQSTDTVLEYGVGSGWNLAELRCGRRLGYDVATFLKDDVEKRDIRFLSDISEIEPGSVDFVLSHHTLEHLLHPAAALETLHRVLRPGGTLLLIVPLEFGSRTLRIDPNDPNHHLYSWNVQTLANLVGECGYEVVSATQHLAGWDRVAAEKAHRFGLGEKGFRCLRALRHWLKPLKEVRVLARRP